MKATRVFGLWKAIAFLTAVIFFSFSFSGCCPDNNEPVLKPTVEVFSVMDATSTTATLSAYIIPRGEVRASFEYGVVRVDSTMGTIVDQGVFQGYEKTILTYRAENLEPNTKYWYRVRAINAANGQFAVSEYFFTTRPLDLAVVKIFPAEGITMDQATLKGVLVPIQDNTTALFKYKAVSDESWQSVELGNFNGNDSIFLEKTISVVSNEKYDYCLVATNAAGETSDTTSFQAYGVADVDGNLYHMVEINDQMWLKENFKGTHYANGDPIPNVTDLVTWGTLTTGAYCYYDNDPKNGNVYGALYNWYVGTDPRRLIPGWHTPTGSEFEALKYFLGGTSGAYYAGPKLMDNSGLYWKNISRKPGNESGFTAIPGGWLLKKRETDNFSFEYIGEVAIFWASSCFYGMPESAGIDRSCVFETTSLGEKKQGGLSLRLVR